jgi:hypothetical protein
MPKGWPRWLGWFIALIPLGYAGADFGLRGDRFEGNGLISQPHVRGLKFWVG